MHVIETCFFSCRSLFIWSIKHCSVRILDFCDMPSCLKLNRYPAFPGIVPRYHLFKRLTPFCIPSRFLRTNPPSIFKQVLEQGDLSILLLLLFFVLLLHISLVVPIKYQPTAYCTYLLLFPSTAITGAHQVYYSCRSWFPATCHSWH